MTREQKYTEQLKKMGIYQEAFDPEIRMLAMMERELQRMTKSWKAEGAPVTDVTAQGSPIRNKTLESINSLRRDILSHRDALGLTPKGYNRLRPKSVGEQETQEEHKTVLELLSGKRAGA